MILEDLTTSTILFENGQVNEMTNSTSFTLGQVQSDSDNSGLLGSISGTFVGGDQYEWSAVAGIQQLINIDDSATATGGFDLMMPTPLPRSACAGLLLLAALAAGRAPPDAKSPDTALTGSRD